MNIIPLITILALSQTSAIHVILVPNQNQLSLLILYDNEKFDKVAGVQNENK
jgi:hypothetical protein